MAFGWTNRVGVVGSGMSEDFVAPLRQGETDLERVEKAARCGVTASSEVDRPEWARGIVSSIHPVDLFCRNGHSRATYGFWRMLGPFRQSVECRECNRIRQARWRRRHMAKSREQRAERRMRRGK